MQSRYSSFLVFVTLFATFPIWGQVIQSSPAQNAPAQAAPQVAPQSGQKNGGDFSDVANPDPKNVVPKDTIIVKGAWSSASDSTTPVPESGAVTNSVFTNRYFAITYPLPADWAQKFTPPPPSETGSYVLAQISRTDTYKGEAKGSIQFEAHDMFFTPLPSATAQQFVNYSKDHLPDYYQLELKPSQTTIGGRPFTFFAYWSPVAQLHWYVLATQIRCHTVEIVLMNRDTKVLEELVRDMNSKMKLPSEAGTAGGGSVPVCIKNYANGENVIERVEPVLTERRYNAIPVRIIIDKQGKIKHIHFLSAFPEQEKAISDALKQWRFRPYERDGQRLEVETGIMFGRASLPVAPGAVSTTD
ncbi:MAG TPA: hypothetical protein VG759_19935 [Candidatus Angelobacter sp.]|jgi:hypothetical protein|nr:hypothetical protein [Candidatus Angelobacter sp.]